VSGALHYRWRAELRGRWRAWVALGLLIALMGGAVLALVAGARRTDSAFARLVAAEGAPHVRLGTFGGMLDPEVMGSLPEVAEWWAFHRYAVRPEIGDEHFLTVLAPVDQRADAAAARWKLLDGRRADPARPDEVVVSSTVAEIYELGVGDAIRLAFLSPAELEVFYAGGPMPPPAAVLTPQVVGVVAPATELPPRPSGDGAGVVLLTAAAAGALGDELVDDVWFEARLRDGFASAAGFEAGARPLIPPEVLAQSTPDLPTTMDAWRSTEAALRVPAVGLWILAGLTAVTAVLIGGQFLSRAVHTEAGDHPVLAALGLGPGELWLLALARIAVVGAVGALGAATIAVAISPLFPLGLGRVAEPAPGMLVDLTAVGVGAVAVLAVALALAAWPAWRRARATVAWRRRPTPGRVVAAALRGGVPPAAVAGLGFGLHSGDGRNAVPVRSSITSIAIGVAALVVAVIFGASLSHLLATPHLYGWTWDVEVGDGWGPDASEGLAASLEGNESVAAVAQGTTAVIDVEGRTSVLAITMDDVAGRIEPAVAEGRAPTGPEEVLLGTRVLRDLGLRVGDEVSVRVSVVSWNQLPEPTEARSMTVVGHGPTPELLHWRIGDAAILTGAALAAWLPEPPPANHFLLRWADVPEADRVLPDFGWLSGSEFGLQRPADIVNFGRVESFPLIAAGLMALIAVAVLTHVLMTAVRRKGRDLAVLKVLGFTRRQLAATVSWQASTIAVTAVLLGLPLGVVAGRWGWMLFADRAGVIPVAVVPIGAVAVVIAAALVAGNAVAALPAGAAVRTRPAAVLRTE
jgi:ABC-type lipoprotein release transport system permease subunit